MRTILVFGTSGCGKATFLEALKAGDKRFWTIEVEKELKRLTRKGSH